VVDASTVVTENSDKFAMDQPPEQIPQQALLVITPAFQDGKTPVKLLKQHDRAR
jgi:hypothetical protein